MKEEDQELFTEFIERARALRKVASEIECLLGISYDLISAHSEKIQIESDRSHNMFQLKDIGLQLRDTAVFFLKEFERDKK